MSERSKTLFIRNGLEAALRLCETPFGASLIDIGAGNTDHGAFFRKFYPEYFTNDFIQKPDPYHIEGDIFDVPIDRKFDVVYASNVLEHQKDVGAFIKRLMAICNDGGYIALIVPIQHHHKLLFGHLTSWTPGILIYNMVMAGLDCAEAKVCRGKYEISVIVQNKPAAQVSDIARSAAAGWPEEMDQIKRYFPFDFFAGCTADMDSIRWPETYNIVVDHALEVATVGDELFTIAPGSSLKVPQGKARKPWWY